MLKNYAENEAGKFVPELFLFSKKALYEVKASGLELRSRAIDQEICSILIF